LRSGLAELCTNERKRMRLQRAAFKRAKHYSMRRMADSYEWLYRSIASVRSGQSQNAMEVCA